MYTDIGVNHYYGVNKCAVIEYLLVEYRSYYGNMTQP